MGGVEMHTHFVGPTYWPTDVTRSPDLLDYFISKGLSHNYLDIKPNPETAFFTSSIKIITGQQSTKLHNSKIN
jgi:hypothetical protein